MPLPITTLADTTDFIFVNGLYFDQKYLTSPQIAINLLKKNPEHICVKDIFLTHLIRRCRIAGFPLTAVPLEFIPSMFREIVSYEIFNSSKIYYLDINNGYLWELSTITAMAQKVIDDFKCPITLNKMSFIKHPFAMGLADAMNEAVENNKSTVNFEEVFQKAIKQKSRIENVPKMITLRQFPRVKDTELNFSWYIFIRCYTTIFIFLLLMTTLPSDPESLLAFLLFSVCIMEFMETSEKIYTYVQNHEQILEKLDVHLKKFSLKPNQALGAILILSSLINPSGLVRLLSLASFGLEGVNMILRSRSPAKLLSTLIALRNIPSRNDHNSFNYLIYGAFYAFFSLYVFISLYNPFDSVGYLPEVLGTYSFLNLTCVGYYLISRLIMNKLVVLKLDHLHPQIELLTTTQPEHVQKLISFTAPKQLLDYQSPAPAKDAAPQQKTESDNSLQYYSAKRNNSCPRLPDFFKTKPLPDQGVLLQSPKVIKKDFK